MSKENDDLVIAGCAEEQSAEVGVTPVRKSHKAL